MKPLKFVKEHKVEIGVGIVATITIIGIAGLSYKFGSRQGVDKLIEHLRVIQNEAKKINEEIPVLIDEGTVFEIPMKICPNASIIDGFVKDASLTKIF